MRHHFILYPLYCLLLFPNISLAQKVYENSTSDADLAFTLDKKKEKNLNYSAVEEYFCKTPSFNIDSCRCTEIKRYNKTNDLVFLTAGRDVLRGAIDYKISPVNISDSIAVIKIEYAKRKKYGRKGNPAFYKKDEDMTGTIKSILELDSSNILPEKITHFNKTGDTVAVYYPWGLRKSIKSTDTLLTVYGKIISFHQYFAENEFHTVSTFNKKDKLIEFIEINDSYEGGYVFFKDIYFYDTAGKISFVIHTDTASRIRSIDRYYYKEGRLVKLAKYCQPDGPECYEERIYDENGNIMQEKVGADIRKYVYEGGLLKYILFYDEEKFLFSHYFRYE